MSRSLSVKNIGPLKNLTIDVPDGGVIVLQGGNGTGKSHCLDATRALLAGSGSLSVRDGELRGEVEGFDARISVARSTRRTGECSVVHLEGRYDPSLLADPGISDPSAADARRIRALVALSGLKLDPEALAMVLPGGKDALESLVKPTSIVLDDPVKTCAMVKKDLETHARAEEAKRDQADQTAKSHLRAIEGVDLSAEHDDLLLQSELEQALADQALLRERKNQAESASERVHQARQQLERIRGKAAGVTVADAKDALQQVSSARAAKRGEVDDLQQRLAAAKAELATLDARVASHELALEAAIEAADQIDQCEALIASAGSVVAPTEAEIAAAADRVSAARDGMQRGVLVRNALTHKKRADEAIEEMQRHDKTAKSYRDAAAKTDEVLSGMVAQASTALAVEAGRLITETSRGKTYFADLSEGERWKIAMDVAIGSVGEGGVLVIPQIAWESLDVPNRQMVADLSASSKVVVLTAEATEGELTHTVLPGGNGQEGSE